MSWNDRARSCTPYVPGEQPADPEQIKLNTNENPFPPSPLVREALASMTDESFRRYPDPKCSVLNKAIAEHYGVSEDRVFSGVGSDDVLSMAFLAFFGSEDPVLFPDITYSFYDVWADIYKIPYETVPLDESFRIRLSDYDRPCGGIVIANPNAPTGIALSLDEIEALGRAHRDVVVIIDEAYVDFGADSAIPLIDRYDNLLVVQTFSKSRALAGLRVGYALGQAALIRHLHDVKYSVNSYTLNAPALTAASAAIADRSYYETQQSRIRELREYYSQELQKMGFCVTPSKANFLFVSHPEHAAKDLFEALRENHIYVRWFDKDRIRNHLRITIGTKEQMEALIKALQTIMDQTVTSKKGTPA